MDITVTIPLDVEDDLRTEFRRRLGDSFPQVDAGGGNWVDDPAVDPLELYLNDLVNDESAASRMRQAKVAVGDALTDTERKDALLLQHDATEAKVTLHSDRKVRGEQK